MKIKYWLMATFLVFGLSGPTQAQAATLVGITTATITSYIPSLKVKRVKNISFRGQINSKHLAKQHQGMYGPWQDAVETKAAANWISAAGSYCQNSRYYAFSHVQRHFMVIGHVVYYEITTDLVCAD